jgi:hypothetical protein
LIEFLIDFVFLIIGYTKINRYILSFSKLFVVLLSMCSIVLIVASNLAQNGDQSEAEADSEAEKMSPLLDTSRSTDAILVCSPRSEKAPSIPSSPPLPVSLMSQGPAPTAADDSDYYTPDDQGPGNLLDSDKV